MLPPNSQNLEIYLSTKDQIPNMLFSSAAQGGMRIWYNNEYPGVCVKGDYFAVETWAEYEMYESSFLKAEELAKKKAAELEAQAAAAKAEAEAEQAEETPATEAE